MQQRSKTVWMLVVGITFLVGLVVWMSGNTSESSSFGMKVIQMEGGGKVYLVRESWGLHTDEISIRQSPNGCSPANPERDYIERDAESIIYSEDNGKLRIFKPEGPFGLRKPQRPWTAEVVQVITATTPSWLDLDRNPKKYGVIVAEVPLNEFCWLHLFSPVSSLRPTVGGPGLTH